MNVYFYFLTENGGLQEQATALKVPGITVRRTTEYPVTLDVGLKLMVGTDQDKIITETSKIISGNWKESRMPDLWDGKASERRIKVLVSL